MPLARFLRVSTSSVRIPLPPGKNNHALSGVMIFSGGGRGIRTLVTWITGKTVFETAAFNHSAIPPYSIVSAQVCPNHIRQARTYKKSPFGGENSKWRRDGDSNPRYAFGAYTISNRAPSASSDISPLHHLLRNAICIAAEGKYSAE